MDRAFVKLKDLIDSTFEVLEVPGFSYKFWDNDNRKMLVSEIYLDGYRKLYQVKTNKGQLDLGSGQLGNLLEATFYKGESNLINKTFEVTSNGKSGIDIRYYFKVLKNQPKLEKPVDQPPAESYSTRDEVDLDSLPF